MIISVKNLGDQILDMLALTKPEEKKFNFKEWELHFSQEHMRKDHKVLCKDGFVGRLTSYNSKQDLTVHNYSTGEIRKITSDDLVSTKEFLGMVKKETK